MCVLVVLYVCFDNTFFVNISLILKEIEHRKLG